jgi:hypothetical protein
MIFTDNKSNVTGPRHAIYPQCKCKSSLSTGKYRENSKHFEEVGSLKLHCTPHSCENISLVSFRCNKKS